MNSLRLAAAVAATLLVAAAAEARPFYVTQSSDDVWTVMDPQGIEVTPGSPIRKAWAVRVQRNILTGDPPQPGYVRTLSEYDCAARRTRWLEFTAYSRAGGMLINKVNPQPEWAPATAASDIHAAYRVVCEGVGGRAAVSADSVAKVVINLMGSWDSPLAPLLPISPAASPVAKGKAPPAKATPAKPGAPAAKPTPVR